MRPIVHWINFPFVACSVVLSLIHISMTGYLPDFDFLRNSGIELIGENLNPIYNPETMETNIENLYLAGVVCGGKDTHLWFIAVSYTHRCV